MARGDIIINMTKEEAEKILEHLPGTPEMYHEIADAFLDAMGESGYSVPDRRHRHRSDT